MGERIAMDWDELEQAIEECRLAGAGRVWLRALTEAAGREPWPPFNPRPIAVPEVVSTLPG
jgi:hypothetical protein